MTETEFLALAGQVLDALENQAGGWDAALPGLDIEASRDGNVLTLMFNNRSPVVVNTQTPLRELWMASRGGAFHYRYDGERWNDTRGGLPLPQALSQVCSEAAGIPLEVRL
jgi:CyaY protein